MTPINPHTINASLIALPAAMALTRRLLLAHKSQVTASSSPLDERLKLIEVRANGLTDTLKNIEGYRHGGLND